MDQLANDVWGLLYTHMLPAARVLGILVFLPGLSSDHVPAQARMVVAGGVALLVASATGAETPLPESSGALMVALVGELSLGLVVGWAVAVFFESLRWSGEVLDMQIGLRAGQFFDPLTSHGGTLIGQLYHLTALTFFFVIDGHHWVLAAIGRSFERIPAGEVAFGGSTVALLLDAAASAVDISVRMAVAGVAALLLADIALAIVGRHVPQMNVFLVGIPGKLAAGIIVLAVCAPMLGGVMGALVAEVKHYVLALLVGG